MNDAAAARNPVPGLGTWFGWVVLTTLGGLIASITGSIGFTITANLYRSLDQAITGNLLLFSLVFNGIDAVFVGLGQWLVLLAYIRRAAWWIVATVGGACLATAAVVLSHSLIGERLDAVSSRIAFALVFALPQWVVLRSWTRRALWWFPITIAASLASYLIVWPQLAAGPEPLSFVDSYLGGFIRSMLNHLEHAVVTGAGIVLIAPRSSREGLDSKRSETS